MSLDPRSHTHTGPHSNSASTGPRTVNIGKQRSTTRFLKIIIDFCYQQSYHLAEIVISTGVPNPLESSLVSSTVDLDARK